MGIWQLDSSHTLINLIYWFILDCLIETEFTEQIFLKLVKSQLDNPTAISPASHHSKRSTSLQPDLFSGQLQQPQQITLQVQPQQQQATQIQIVSADRIRFSCEECCSTFSTQQELKTHKIQTHGAVQQQQQQQQVVIATAQAQSNALKIKNCESCGAPLPQDNNKKRAVMKVKCESCLSAESIQPQIFVVATAPDTTTVKFEESTGTQTNNTNLGTYEQVIHRGPFKCRFCSLSRGKLITASIVDIFGCL